MSRIPDRVLEEIQQRSDIVDIISGYIPLKKAGNNFKALCPFHHEKTPSFTVNADKQIYHCFGCGAGGDVFSFIMAKERLEFPEAVRFLAEKAGVIFEVEESGGRTADKRSVRTKLYRINELAAQYYQEQLRRPDGEAARRYLAERNLSAESIKLFRLGFSPDKWNGLSNVLLEKKVPEDLIVRSGLALRNPRGGVYDRFRGRIMFPICDIQNRVVAFGGRVLRQEKSSAKYINSPETEIYSKGKLLYGLNLSRDIISRQDCVIIVEGYLDYILPFQNGVKNISASLGTAFTVDHVRLLRRYTQNVVILFDPDEAGQGAALRSLDILMEEGMNVRVAELPEGLDPDTFVRKQGGKPLQELVGKARGLFDYRLDVLTKKYRKEVPEENARIAGSMLEMIGRLKNDIVREAYIRQLASELRIKEVTLLSELKRTRSGGSSEFVAKERSENKSKLQNMAEKMLMSLLFDDSLLLKRVKQLLNYEEFSDPRARRLARHLFEQKEADVKPAVLMSRLNDNELNAFISNLIATDWGIEDREKIFNDCVSKIKRDGIKNRLDELQKKITGAVDEQHLKILLHEYHTLKKEQKLYEKGIQKDQRR